jgi:GT2 family glycosyltransferase
MTTPGHPSVSPDTAFGGSSLSIGVQSVLFNNEFRSIDRAVGALARAAELAILGGACTRVTLQYGDCSPSPCLNEQQLESLRERYSQALTIAYKFFEGNLGSARAHNRLADANQANILLVQNPDVVVSPRLLEIMLGEFAVSGVGMVEAKQLPIEHPKDYDVQTGETSWATTACAMIPMPLFRQLGGFDASTFFLYCDDVDFSWQVRLAGFRVIFQPAAVAFHDKRLSIDGAWLPSNAESYFSAEAALLLSYKWSREDVTERCLREFKRTGADHLIQAAEEYERRRAEGRLPAQLDQQHRIGQFVDRMYAKHRFRL